MSLIFKLIIIIFFLSTNLFALELTGKFEQGSFILGKTNPNSKVKIDNRNVRVSKEGYFAFGLDRDRSNNVLITIKTNGKTKKVEKKVIKREYKIQRIDGLPPKQVTPPPEVYERIKKDNIGREVETIEIPRPFKILGKSWEFEYFLRPGLLIL